MSTTGYPICADCPHFDNYFYTTSWVPLCVTCINKNLSRRGSPLRDKGRHGPSTPRPGWGSRGWSNLAWFREVNQVTKFLVLIKFLVVHSFLLSVVVTSRRSSVSGIRSSRCLARGSLISGWQTGRTARPSLSHRCAVVWPKCSRVCECIVVSIISRLQ